MQRIGLTFIDLLDDFSAAKIGNQKPAETAQPSASKPAPAATVEDTPPPAQDDFSEEDFSKQLQAGMAELLGDLENSPDMQNQFEEMFKQMSAAAGAEGGAEEASKTQPGGSGASGPSASKGGDSSFQETIRKTMERMQNSGEQATAAANSSTEDDFMSELLKQMSSGDLGGEGNEEEFSKMLMGMMEQLTNKEILYEPMKELHDKFPGWLEKNRATTPAEDLKRYDEQQVLVKEIVGKFEEPTYTDSNPKDREYIVERMQKVSPAPLTQDSGNRLTVIRCKQQGHLLRI